MPPREILILRSSEIAENVHFAINSASSKLSRRTTKLHEKGYFARVFEKWEEHVPLGPPSSYVHATVF